MKIRNPTVIKWIGFFGAVIIRCWIGTLALRYRCLGENVYPDLGAVRQNTLAAFWHENILVPCYLFARQNVSVLISQHADGEMIAQVCKHIGYATIRGSKTRGGMKAMRELIRASKTGHIAVMPDGPRGPRRHVELGLIYLAANADRAHGRWPRSPVALEHLGSFRPAQAVQQGARPGVAPDPCSGRRRQGTTRGISPARGKGPVRPDRSRRTPGFPLSRMWAPQVAPFCYLVALRRETWYFALASIEIPGYPFPSKTYVQRR